MELATSSPTSPLAPTGLAVLARAKARHQRLLNTRQSPVVAMSPWLPVTLLTIICSLVFFAVAPLSVFDETDSYSEWGTALGGLALSWCMGAVPAQIILLGLIVACSPTPLWRRLATLALQLGLIFAALTTGALLFEAISYRTWGDDEWRDELILFTCLPIVALLCSLPLWFVRLLLGWELTRVEPASAAGDDEDDEVSYHQPATVGQLVLSAAAALGCFVLLFFTPAAEYSFEPPPFVGALMLGLTGLLLSFIIGLPLIFFFTRIRRALIRWAIPLTVAALLGGVAYLITFFNSDELELTAHARYVSLQAMLFFGGGVGGVAFGLAIFRWFGWTVRPVLTRTTY